MWFEVEVPDKLAGTLAWIVTEHNKLEKDDQEQFCEDIGLAAREWKERNTQPPFDENHYRFHTPNKPLQSCAWCKYLNWWI